MLSPKTCQGVAQARSKSHSAAVCRRADQLASTGCYEEAIALYRAVLDANPADYDVIFTANASSAIRILNETFPFGRRSRLVLIACRGEDTGPIRRFREQGSMPLQGCVQARMQPCPGYSCGVRSRPASGFGA